MDNKRKLFRLYLVELFGALIILGDYVYWLVAKEESASILTLIGGLLILVTAIIQLYQLRKRK